MELARSIARATVAGRGIVARAHAPAARTIPVLGVGAVVWLAVATAMAIVGQISSAVRGTPQPFWPSLGYALAIFSVWIMLSPPLMAAARRVRRSAMRTRYRFALLLAGLPVTVAAHVGLFALLFWPLYHGDRTPTRWAMAEHMFVRNLDMDLVLYLAVIAAAVWWRPGNGQSTGGGAAEPPDATEPAGLTVRTRGRIRFIALADIEWIRAAGDYSEIRAAGRLHLADLTIGALERSLPRPTFARVHRSTIVRVDRIVEIRSSGHGDAMLTLASGSEVRLSRRYRDNLPQLLRAR